MREFSVQWRFENSPDQSSKNSISFDLRQAQQRLLIELRTMSSILWTIAFGPLRKRKQPLPFPLPSRLPQRPVEAGNARIVLAAFARPSKLPQYVSLRKPLTNLVRIEALAFPIRRPAEHGYEGAADEVGVVPEQ